MTRSEQARADALADAETLRLYLDGDAFIEPRLSPVDGPLLAELDDPRHASKVARAVARKAFRAVPGLRGE